MNDDFKHYLHLKRWIGDETHESIKRYDETKSHQAYCKMWCEAALEHIENYESTHPDWKILGDEECINFWDRK